MNTGSFAQFELDKVKRGLQDRGLGWIDELEYFESIPSSNDHLMAADSPLHGRLCIAGYQSRGKGRHGKQWLSTPGQNLMFSLGWSPPVTPGTQLSLVVGLAIADALCAEGVAGVALKWPNDVLLGEAKLGGILLESRVRCGHFEFVIGVGLNIRQQADELSTLENSWADLADSGFEHISREALLLEILSQLDARLKQFQTQGFTHIRHDWLGYYRHQGAEMVYQHNGRQCVGRVIGLGEDGALQLQTDGRQISVHSGEVNTMRPVS